jgi:hypothetical protein
MSIRHVTVGLGDDRRRGDEWRTRGKVRGPWREIGWPLGVPYSSNDVATNEFRRLIPEPRVSASQIEEVAAKWDREAKEAFEGADGAQACGEIEKTARMDIYGGRLARCRAELLDAVGISAWKTTNQKEI